MLTSSLIRAGALAVVLAAIGGAAVSSPASAAEPTVPPACTTDESGGRCEWIGPARAALDTSIPVPPGVERVEFVAVGHSTCSGIPVAKCSDQVIVSGTLDLGTASSIDVEVGGLMSGYAELRLRDESGSQRAVYAPGRPFPGEVVAPAGSQITIGRDGLAAKISLSWTN